ncbi:TPM domain-containing protein [Clostridium brassicae]|uniref:TPM domain-containing protein n=1 Tax=Clostridium brassicae TaxID=2999072 RepID=A0ABT4D6Q8_9CLOT|nr:TPM domain-containing protein [Clostridium brassicae]MCY6957986.1 TPM domain-containing protein [Clostridium brassicae]
MKLKFRILLATLLLCLLSFTVYAADSYIKDNAGVLSSSTLNQVNKNFSKLETNTKAQVKIFVVKSLNGKNINDFTSNLIKTSTKGDKYAIFVVSIKDHKNKFVVGSGLNAVFNKSKIQKIVSLPNPYFKKKDFNTGILKVGQAIDQSITSTAVKSGQAKVVDKGLSKSVEPETSHTGLIIFLITVFVIIVFIVYSLKKRSDRNVENLARRHGLDNFQNNNASFRSSNVSNNNRNFNNPTYEPPYRRTDERYYSNSRNNRGDFVKGMVVGGLVTHGIDKALEHNHHTYNSSYNDSYDEDTELTSGDWNLSDGTSDWGDDSSSDYDSNSNWGDDSSSDYDSSDWDDSSSDYDSDSSDW